MRKQCKEWQNRAWQKAKKVKQDKESAIGVPLGTFDAAAMRRQNKLETRFDLYPESWTFFKRDSVISGIELDS